MILRLTFLFLFTFVNHLFVFCAQPQDTLGKRSYDYLYDRIDQNTGTLGVTCFLEAYLKKAKKEGNLKEIINGYNNFLYEVDPSQKLFYADSMIYAAERTDSNELIGSAILTKGIIYYQKKDYTKALDLYLIANRLIASTNSQYLKHKIQYNIAHIKYYLGFFNEALALYRSCTEYFKSENPRAYLNCLHSIALCYTRLGNYDESTEINSLVIQECIRLNDESIIPFILQTEGINDYFRKSYTSSIHKLKNSLSGLQEQNDFGNLSIAYFYIAASLWHTGKKEEALPYLLKVDRFFTDKKYIRPDLRRNYELLIDYYRDKSDKESELHYIKRLMQADRILHSHYKYLSGKVFKEYDTAQLVEAKNTIENSLRKERYLRILLLGLSIALLSATIFLIFRNLKLRQYKKNFERYKENTVMPVASNSSKEQRPNVSIELEQELLTKLERFENTQGFIKKDLRIEKLAVSFGTNYKYLSQVINYHKGKSYPDYISDLRIAYIIKKLEEESKLRHYTFAAIAEEASFGTAQQFTEVFKKKMGMPFSFFLEQLEKND